MVTGPICIEEAVDVWLPCAYAPQRDEAETEVFSFARRQLPRNDLFSEAFFAATGKLAVAPARLSSLSAKALAVRASTSLRTFLPPYEKVLHEALPHKYMRKLAIGGCQEADLYIPLRHE